MSKLENSTGGEVRGRGVGDLQKDASGRFEASVDVIIRFWLPCMDTKN